MILFWFRRDLRLEDNCGLYYALGEGVPVLPLFIFDRDILDKLDDRHDARVTFIYDEISRLKRELEQQGSTLLVRYGKSQDVFKELTGTFNPVAVYSNHDYEPYARERDESVRKVLERRGIKFRSFKDQVIFEKDEVVKDSGEPYTVYTPYSRKWKARLYEKGAGHFPSETRLHSLQKSGPITMPTLESMGFERSTITVPPRKTNPEIIRQYHLDRDFPSRNGTSRLGAHLRFGTISARQLVSVATETNEVFLNELIWREFYMMILWHHPHAAQSSFKKEYDRIEWRNREEEFAAWCEGKTGYPIVDAGMRQLNLTGYMHNRVRMITASFLAKHLLIDWRWGEAYFAKKLLDYELASNNGGWQWAAGTGCDAAPYFRVFNPALQAQKFDPEGLYIRTYVPELNSLNYARPIVEHAFARDRAIKSYKKALAPSG